VDQNFNISLTLFAHINNDAFLAGARNLEGLPYSTTIQFLQHFLKNSNGLLLPEVLERNQRSLTSLQQKLDSMLIASHELENVHAKMTAYDSIEECEVILKEAIQPLVDRILKNLADSDNQFSVLMPGGWSGKPSGHAMAYEFKKDIEGNLLFLVYNSGAGLNYHEEFASTDKQRYQTTKIFKILKTEINQEKIADFILELVKPRVLPKIVGRNQPTDVQYNEEVLYTQVFAKIVQLNGEEIAPKELSEHYQAIASMAQRTGTCTEKSLHELIKNSIENKKDAKFIIFSLKLYSIELFLKKDLTEITHPKSLSQLKWAVENLARILNKQGEDFPAAYTAIRQRAEQAIESVEKFFHENESSLVSVKYQSIHSKFIRPEVFQTKFLIRDEAVQLVPSTETIVVEPYDHHKINYVQSAIDSDHFSLDKLKNFTEKMEFLCKKGLNKEAEQQIFDYFTTLPLSSSYFSQVDTVKKASDLIDLMHNLLQQYAHVVRINNKNDEAPLNPKRWVVLLSVVEAIDLAVRGKNIGLISHGVDGFGYKLNTIKQSFKFNPYLATHSPELDLRIKTIFDRRLTDIPPITNLANLTKWLSEDKASYAYLNKLYHHKTQTNDSGLSVEEQNLIQNNGCQAAVAYMYFLEKEPSVYEVEAQYVTLFKKTRLLMDCLVTAFTTYDLYGFNRLRNVQKNWISVDKYNRNILKEHFLTEYSLELLSSTSPVSYFNIIQDKEIKDVLVKDFRNSFYFHLENERDKIYDDNQIFSKPINSWLYQELIHLRTSPALQFLTTIDFFTNNLDLFSGEQKSDLHEYLRKNIFQPGILIAALEHNQESLEQFNQFANKAVVYFSENTQNRFNSDVLAFIELQVEVNNYALKYIQDNSALKDNVLSLQFKRLNELTDIDLELLSATERYTVAKLKIKLYLNLINQGYFNQEHAHTLFNLFMDFSLYGRNVSFVSQQERDLHKEITDSCVTNLFISGQEQIYSFALEWARQNGMNDALLEKIQPSPQSSYPYYYGVVPNGKVVLSLDLTKGEILLEDATIGYLPENILTSGLYRESQLGVEKSTLMMSRQVCCDVINNRLVKKHATINEQPSFNFLETTDRYSSPILIHQQEKTVNNHTQYYELQKAMMLDGYIYPLMCCHLNFPQMDYTNSFTIKLPELFFGAETKYWLACDKNTILIEKGKNRYCVERESKVVKELDQNNLETGFVLSTFSSLSQISAVFEKFEDKEFIEVLFNSEQNQHKTLKIKLVRYNIELHGKFNEQDNKWVFHLADKPNVVLVDSANISIQPLISNGLVFKDLESNKRFIYTPNQFYYINSIIEKNKPEQDFETVYHQPILDTANVNKRLNLGLGVKELEIAEESDVKNTLPAGRITYANTEKYFIYELSSEKNQLQAGTSEEKLYLAYLNLIHIQPAAALKSIQSIIESGGLRGTVEELEVIDKIMNGAPLLVTQIDSPEFIAVKMHILYLVCDLVSQQKDFVLPDSNTLPKNTPDEFIIKKQNKQLEEFKKTFAGLTQKYLEANLNNRANISKTMRLPRVLEYKILSRMNIKENGSLQLKNRYEHLKNWYRIRELAKLQTTAGAEKNKNRIERLQNKLVHPKQVIHPVNKFMTSHLVKVVLQKSFDSFNPNNINDFNKLLMQSSFVNYQSLNLKLTDEDFLSQFVSLFDLARSTDEDLKPQREKLRLFLNQMVKAGCNISEKKQKSIIPAWAATLLNVLDYPADFQYISLDNNSVMETQLFAYQIFVQKIFQRAFALNPTREIQVNGCFPIEQPVDITSKYAKNKSKKIDKYTPDPMAISDNPEAYESLLYKDFLIKADLNAFYQAIQQLENKTDQTILELKEVLSKKTSDRRYEETVELRRACDEAIGALKNQKTIELRKITHRHLAGSRKQGHIVFECEKLIKKLGGLIETTQKTVLDLANQGPTDDLTSQKKYQLALSGRKREKLKLNDLNRLFVLADKKEYQRVTGLNKKADIQKLHDTMAQYINYGILKTQYEKIKDELETFIHSTNQGDITPLGDVLSAKNIISLTEEPALQFFQQADEKLIRPIQKHYLNKLLYQNKETGKFNNEVIQIIMGGGKSKLIGPLAALNKADGTNLVVFQVKNSLLKINHADMAATSQRLFNQKAVVFEFDRSSPSTSHDLKQLYKLFYTASVDKNYIVTSGTSLQSLELKYLETLAHPPVFENKQEKTEWEKQIKWFEKSLLFLKLKGDRIIDEIHDELDPTKELNYTLDDSISPSSEDIKLSMDLFFFLREVSIADIVGVESKAYDLIFNNKLISDPKKQFEMIMERVATQLVCNAASVSKTPIAEILNKLNLIEEQDKLLLINFLLGKNDKILSKLKVNLTPREIDELSFIKFELSTILPFTLSKNYNEHYGPSRKKGVSAMNAKLAIPYKALNTPNERARFGQFVEAMNYTIQMNLIEPLSYELIIELIDEYRHKTKIEILNSNDLDFDSTIASKEFEKIFGYNLEAVLKLNKEEFDNLIKIFQQSDSFKKAFLAAKALPLVQINPTVLSSNSQNLASMTRTTQGMTGTPWNDKSYHQDIYFEENESIGTDGETIDLLKSKNKQNTVLVCEAYAQVEKLLEEVSNKELEHFKKIRAIIDVGALFKQENSNLEVAKKIGEFYKNNDQRLGAITKFVLFVDNQNNQLYAWDVKKQCSIKLEETDEKAISKILGCKSEERFTFYDQARITGTDIAQGPNAQALVTFSDKTIQSDLLQGVKRLRQFTHNQSVTLIQPSYLAKNNRLESNMESVLAFVNKNQVDKCLQMHLKATGHKFKNVLRNHFMDFIYKEEDAHKKHQLLKMFYSFFSKTYHLSHFKNYGAIESNLEAQKEYFEPLAQKYNDQWFALMKKAGLSVSTEKQVEIQNGLNNIAKAGIESCAAQILSTPILGFDSQKEEKQVVDLGAEVENQIENDNETDKELQLDQELLTDENNVKAYTEVVVFTLGSFFDPDSALMINTPPIDANNNYVTGEEDLFDNHIMISAMQAKTIETQASYYAKNVKPIHAILMVLDKNMPEAETLNAFILAKKEADYYAKMSQAELQTLHPEKHLWLVSPSDKLLAGTRPEILPSNYLRTLEQIRFVNGDCRLISQQKEGITWLKENAETKLKFLKNTILPRFKYKAKFYHLLTRKLKALSKHVQFPVLQAENENRELERKVAAENREIKLNLKRKTKVLIPAVTKQVNLAMSESEIKVAADANVKRKQKRARTELRDEPRKNLCSVMFNCFSARLNRQVNKKKRQEPVFERIEQEGIKRARV
jgi:hypothetical protein